MNRKDYIKNKLSTTKRMNDYSTIILNSGLSMFEYTGINKEFIINLETFLLLEGECAVWKNNNKLIVSPCTRIGAINEYGVGKDLNCITLNGINQKFENFEECDKVVYIRNNSTATSDDCINWYAYALSEIDTSIILNVINSRYLPLVSARTTKEKAVIETALKTVRDGGEPQVVLQELDNLFKDEPNYTKILNITDVTNSDKIQYLSHAHDDIIRRLYNLYGMDIKGTGKMAQQTIAEVNNGDNSFMIIPYDKLEQRKKAVEEINKKFGTNITIDFSRCWKREEEERELTLDKMKSETEQNKKDRGVLL